MLATIKGAALGGLLTLVVVGGPGPRAEADAYQRVVERAVAGHHCSDAGLGDLTVPASALIRNARGELRQVTFEIGWDVHNNKLPGTLVAVCLDDTPCTNLPGQNS